MIDRYNTKNPTVGTLYLTATHLIFVEPDSNKETWVSGKPASTPHTPRYDIINYSMSHPVRVRLKLLVDLVKFKLKSFVQFLCKQPFSGLTFGRSPRLPSGCVCQSSTNRKSMLRKYSRPQRHATFRFVVAVACRKHVAIPSAYHINHDVMNLFIFNIVKATILYFVPLSKVPQLMTYL